MIAAGKLMQVNVQPTKSIKAILQVPTPVKKPEPKFNLNELEEVKQLVAQNLDQSLQKLVRPSRPKGDGIGSLVDDLKDFVRTFVT